MGEDSKNIFKIWRPTTLPWLPIINQLIIYLQLFGFGAMPSDGCRNCHGDYMSVEWFVESCTTLQETDEEGDSSLSNCQIQFENFGLVRTCHMWAKSEDNKQASWEPIRSLILVTWNDLSAKHVSCLACRLHHCHQRTLCVDPTSFSVDFLLWRAFAPDKPSYKQRSSVNVGRTSSPRSSRPDQRVVP